MNSTEKLERAALLKDKGTKYFKDGDFSLAIKMYNKVVELVETDAGTSHYLFLFVIVICWLFVKIETVILLI